MNFRRGRHRDEPEINLIPLIDVLLVILIFLMVTTTYQHYAEMQINLPVGQGDVVKEKPKAVDIGIRADGRMTVNGAALAAGDDKGLLSALEAVPPDSEVVINADGKATHQSVISVMEAARMAGLTRLTFSTQAPSP
ncbi:MAG: biopolymer transporter ExbD [Paludibacterium sp.]|uniref:ExbD/TolR family protein n=1 Tax=Paludibacterium sp. TaxID=1917523 RepID=UPI0025DEE87B|nr:biopolymer transporter ExbD [Paludibacterium sp.]MBV8046038.1 biopolymer transporter ExbD [Paludibacterium sp.]MBV8645951.1 biopolymer transporter ExbD [Paludibacterium sp.]